VSPALPELGGPVVVMGVSGAGKSAIASALAARLDVPYLDADDLHPAANKEKMRAGHPLDDEDRWPWLDRVAAEARAAGTPIVACSALRRVYRDRLRAGAPGTVFVELDVARTELERRLGGRHHEYMPATLLDSQLATLEPLQPDERGARIDADPGEDEVVTALLAALSSLR
jgi:gluconokinase